ncbi:RidA family protein [Pseudactinotalea sp. Z1739]|uniref:RidA family protein n=1 Tax=Pseudactinotalea sp. Z1739 TaxID=3413028 RepID=UPI003C7A6E81
MDNYRSLSQPVRLIYPSNYHPVPSYLAPGSFTNGLLFIGGQVALDAHGRLVGSGDIEAQTTQVLKNTFALLDHCGCTVRDLTMVTVYLRSMSYFPGFNRVYERAMEGWAPPRTTTKAELVDPEFLVEIQAIASAAEGQGGFPS